LSGNKDRLAVFLLAVATTFQYRLGLSGAPEFLGWLLAPLEGER
jgi:hypothetical protein